jgi:hypothetical protein
MNKNKGDKIEFKLDPNVKEFYQHCPPELESCMAGADNAKDERTRRTKLRITEFYETQKDNVQMLLLYINGKLSGRALLWSNVENAKGGMYLDRRYHPENKIVNGYYIDYAIKNDWTYRKTNNIVDTDDIANTVDGSDKLKYNCINVEDIDLVPYMDTFRHGEEDGEFNNISGSIDFDNTHGASLDGSSGGMELDEETVQSLVHSGTYLRNIIMSGEYTFPEYGLHVSPFVTTDDARYNEDNLRTIMNYSDLQFNELSSYDVEAFLTTALENGKRCNTIFEYLSDTFSNGDMERMVRDYVRGSESNLTNDMLYSLYDSCDTVLPNDKSAKLSICNLIILTIIDSREFDKLDDDDEFENMLSYLEGTAKMRPSYSMHVNYQIQIVDKVIELYGNIYDLDDSKFDEFALLIKRMHRVCNLYDKSIEHIENAFTDSDGDRLASLKKMIGWK